MRRILYIDYIFLFGHVNFDKIQINALRRTGAEVKLVMHEAFAVRLGFPAQDYELVIPARLNPPAGASPLLNRIYFLRTLLYIRRHVDFRAWDAVVFSTFDEVTMSLVPLCRRKLLFCHGNVTTLGITAKRILMKLIGRHNYFLVFNDYMRRKCLATGLSRTMVVSHGCVKPYRMDRAAERLPFDKSRYSVEYVRCAADSRSAEESAFFVTRGVGILHGFFNILYSNKSFKDAVIISNRKLLYSMLTEYILRLLESCAYGSSNEVFVSHNL